jgi:hypothetical protein
MKKVAEQRHGKLFAKCWNHDFFATSLSVQRGRLSKVIC